MGIITTRLFNRGITTDVLDLLTSQHDQVDALLEQIEKGQGDRNALFAELADNLAAHATVEEKIFYPAVMAKQTDSMLHEAVEEHLQVKRLLADLITMRVDDATFKAKLAVLKEEITHHAHREEEAKLFPKVRVLFDADQRAALGNEVLVMFEELIASSPRQHVPAETTAAAPLPAAR